MEAAELGIFMISACMFGALLEYPGSPAHQAFPDPLLRRVIGGMAMGLTAIGIIYSPWGKRSGAHFNPSVTLTFWRLGKVGGADAFFYIISQFIGAVIGVMLATVVLQNSLTHPSVNYVVTLPGANGVAIAFVAEAIIAFILRPVPSSGCEPRAAHSTTPRGFRASGLQTFPRAARHYAERGRPSQPLYSMQHMRRLSVSGQRKIGRAHLRHRTRARIPQPDAPDRRLRVTA